MAHKLNIVEALKFKNENPNYRVWFSYELENNFGSDIYEEDLVTPSYGESKFQLSEGFDYPSYYDHEDFGWSHYYDRHILGVIFAETESEYIERKNKELETSAIKIEKDKKSLARKIKKQETELKELRNQQNTLKGK